MRAWPRTIAVATAIGCLASPAAAGDPVRSMTEARARELEGLGHR